MSKPLNQKLSNLTSQIKNSANSYNTRAYTYATFGNPWDVLKLQTLTMDKQPNFEIIEAPINPSDINTIEGVYPSKNNETPMVAGHECLGIYTENGTRRLAISRGTGLGTWRESLHVDPAQVHPLPSHFKPLDGLSMMTVNPPTAFRMLKDFETLEKGDTVIQNAANSIVGRCVIQMARHFGIKTINLVRERPGIGETIKELKELGADIVGTELTIPKSLAEFPSVKPPKLALNAVGGDFVTPIARLLAPNSTVVTYGGMSKKPFMMSAGAQIFKNISYKGFWVTRWMAENSIEKRMEMFEEIYNMMASGNLKLKFRAIDFSDSEAVISHLKKPVGKAVLRMKSASEIQL